MRKRKSEEQKIMDTWTDPQTLSLYVTNATILTVIVTFVVTIIVNFIGKKENRLDDLLVRGLSGSAIPTGIVLLFCAFKPSLIESLQGLNVHIAAAGMVLLFVSIKTVFAGYVWPDVKSLSADDDKRIRKGSN